MTRKRHTITVTKSIESSNWSQEISEIHRIIFLSCVPPRISVFHSNSFHFAIICDPKNYIFFQSHYSFFLVNLKIDLRFELWLFWLLDHWFLCVIIELRQFKFKTFRFPFVLQGLLNAVSLYVKASMAKAPQGTQQERMRHLGVRNAGTPAVVYPHSFVVYGSHRSDIMSHIYIFFSPAAQWKCLSSEEKTTWAHKAAVLRVAPTENAPGVSWIVRLFFFCFALRTKQYYNHEFFKYKLIKIYKTNQIRFKRSDRKKKLNPFKQ